MSSGPMLHVNQQVIISAQHLLLAPWYAVQTRGRHEKKVTAQLQEKEFQTFLPLYDEVHDWSDRRKRVSVPLFSGYIFVRIPPDGAARLRILQTAGVVRIVGAERAGSAIPEEQIASIRLVLRQKVAVATHMGLSAGQRVRIVNGALAGTEGVLQGDPRGPRLAISVDAIHRSVSITVTNYDVEPI